MKKFLVTGGGGFLGKALAIKLKQQGHHVISVARGDYPELNKLGIEHHRIDLSKEAEKLSALCDGLEAVFHVAAKVDMWGAYEDFHAANVLATENVVAACLKNKIKYLVFTSSPSVVADGSNLENINETYPYPQKHMAFYPMTKAHAERLVRKANCPELLTVTLRPHLIFGPGDTNLVPTILEKAKAGSLKIIGNGLNKTDLTFIEDCVDAHIGAYEGLVNNPESVAGRAYFISQGEPVEMWQWINQVLSINSLPRLKRKVPTLIAKMVAAIAELICRSLPSKPEPPFTRFLVCEMSTSHYFDISASKRDFGFSPKNTISEAMAKTFGVARLK